MKQNSQSKKETSAQAIADKKLRQEFGYIRRYYMKSLDQRMIRLGQSRQLNPDEKRRIVGSVQDMMFLMDMMFRERQETREYLDCLKEKFKKMMLMLRRLESVGWSIGRYIRKHGFDSDILPMEEFLNHSIGKISEIMSAWDMEMYKCNIHKKD